MSRVGRAPIEVPAGVTVNIDGNHVAAKGKLGELEHFLPDGITIIKEGSTITVSRRDDSSDQRSLHGLSRTLIANMVKGVSEGYKKDLEIVGVGYRAEQKGKAIQFQIGFSHRILFFPPEGVKITVSGPAAFSVTGIDKQLVGEIAAKIRAVRPPEPYRGKGIKYTTEVVRRKAGKSAGK
jgi:large subunit ribosomal protein L6